MTVSGLWTVQLLKDTTGTDGQPKKPPMHRNATAVSEAQMDKLLKWSSASLCLKWYMLLSDCFILVLLCGIWIFTISFQINVFSYPSFKSWFDLNCSQTTNNRLLHVFCMNSLFLPSTFYYPRGLVYKVPYTMAALFFVTFGCLWAARRQPIAISPW